MRIAKINNRFILIRKLLSHYILRVKFINSFLNVWHICCNWKKNWGINDLTTRETSTTSVWLCIYELTYTQRLRGMDKWRRQHLRFQQEQNQNPFFGRGPFSFPFIRRGCNVPTKTNGRKNLPQTISIFGYDNRRSTPTIQPWSQ